MIRHADFVRLCRTCRKPTVGTSIEILRDEEDDDNPVGLVKFWRPCGHRVPRIIDQWTTA